MARDTVQEIKAKLTILDVVGKDVKLTKRGRSYTGLCPFHKEKTPSFHVNIDRGSYHCFGCGEGGDMFTFIEKTEGLEFKEALKVLAERAGVEVTYDPGQREKKSREERLREAMAKAAELYTKELVESSAAYQYALSRGLTKESIKAWALGLAPDSWRTLLEAHTAQGFTLEELMSAGLIKEADGKQGTYYDRFRNRLMFPIRDGAGRTVAFTGRALDPKDEAKYLNSPETDLYHKSEVLFGLDRAKESIRARGFAMLVEGQMDLLLAHQAGFTNTIALSGTAFTTAHAKLLLRYAENLLLVLDADQAGLSASAKAAQLALRAGMRVKAATLPKGEDPADVISRDAQEFARRVKEAKPVVEFFLAALAEREGDQHKLVQLAERVVLPLVRAIPSPLEREHFVGIVARALGLGESSVRETLGRIALAKEPEVGSEVPKAPRERKTPLLSRLEALSALVLAYPESPLAERIKAEYARIVGSPLEPRAPEAAVFLVEETYGEEPDSKAADDLIHAFTEAHMREAYEKIVAELRQAERQGDAAKVRNAQEALNKLSSELGALSP